MAWKNRIAGFVGSPRVEKRMICLHELAIGNCLAHEPFFSPPIALLSPDAYTGIPVIDNDWALQAPNDQISELHASCYGLDSHDQPCWLDEKRRKADKLRMIELPSKLYARITEPNDGC